MLLYISTAITPLQVGLINSSSVAAAVYRKYILMETLRALVSLNGWEFCIIWKLSKDHRFLEWMDCCCAGAEIYLLEPGFAVSQCRDVFVPHSRTKACDLLAKFPSFVNVNDSRVYAETLLSNQPKCIQLSQYPNSDDTEAEVATRLLMHVQGGLVELFAATARQVSESQVLIDYIAENCNFRIENEESLIFSDEFMNQLYNPNVEDDVLLGMFSSLNDDHIQGNDEIFCGNVEMGRLNMISEDEADVEAKYRKKNGKEPQSKNLIAERKRRKKLNERLYKLRSLVPTISKLDRASILGDAIDFVKELQKQKKELEEQLQKQSDDQCEFDSQYDKDNAGKCLRQTEVEVKRIDGSNNVLFVKMLCEKKASGFVRLLEALDYQGLEVIDVNVTTFGTLVSSVLQVQGKEGSWDMVDADCLKETLIEIN